MTYIWQHESWPKFFFSEDKSSKDQLEFDLYRARGDGILMRSTSTERASFALRAMTAEAISTSEIEGIRLNESHVRSSIFHYAHGTHPERGVDEKAKGIAALMIDVKDNSAKPLTKEILNRWQSMIFTSEKRESHSIQIGAYRVNDVSIISGSKDDHSIIYTAPPAERVEYEMNKFLTWYNQSATMPTITKAAISHLYFECIHPYDDGNGRVGRAIAEHALLGRSESAMHLSLSTALLNDKKSYYAELGNASKSDGDITRWLNWFSDKVLESQRANNRITEFFVQKNQFWEKHQDKSINRRQRDTLSRILNLDPETLESGIKSEDYKNAAQLSKATTARDLCHLVGRRMLKKEGAGRGTRYFFERDSHSIHEGAQPTIGELISQLIE